MKQSNGSQQLHNLPSSAQIKWSRYDRKHYLHFDDPVDIKHVKNKIQDPDWVSSHAFFPLIHFEIKFKRYITHSKDKSLPQDQRKQKKDKMRKIYYASHVDRFIYKYYGELLNNQYNEYARDNGIDKVSLAYRNNKHGKNNIDFAYEVFEYLLNQKEAIVIAIDFKEYFDNITHKKLKQNIKRVFKVKELSDDWYKVFKNVTKYAYIKKTDAEALLKQKYGIKKKKGMLKTGKLTKIMTTKDLQSFVKEGKLFKNKKPYGVPQGSGMSAVCSNIQLIDFDKDVKEFAQHYNGLYRRYSDDVIIVIPITNELNEPLPTIESELNEILFSHQDLGIIIQKEKTELRIFRDGKIYNKANRLSELDYLGFATDGEIIKIREKSLFKYYTRAYRKADRSKRIEYVTERKGPRKALYNLYTHLGFNYKERGNFITYATRAHEKMSNLKAKSIIRKQIKRHWNKIHRKLGTK